jgi:peroxiredoxin-like protein
MENQYFYETSVEWQNERLGTLSEPTLPEIQVTSPPEFPGGKPNIWSPEHLYVASVNVCLMTTFTAIAENSNLSLVSYSSDSKGKMERVEKRFQFTEIEVYPKITVSKEKDLERAERIIHKAENVCLISNSIKTKVILKPEISLEEN